MVHYNLFHRQSGKSKVAELRQSIMNGHSLAWYRDGYSQVSFCTECGAEGDKLLEKCEKIVDKKEERT